MARLCSFCTSGCWRTNWPERKEYNFATRHNVDEVMLHAIMLGRRYCQFHDADYCCHCGDSADRHHVLTFNRPTCKIRWVNWLAFAFQTCPPLQSWSAKHLK